MYYLVFICMVAAVFIFVGSIVKGKVINYYPLVEKLLLLAALCLVLEVAVNGFAFRSVWVMVCLIVILVNCYISKASKEQENQK